MLDLKKEAYSFASQLRETGTQKSAFLLNKNKIGVVVQLVRMPACHAGGRGFESRPYRLKALDFPRLFLFNGMYYRVYILYSVTLNKFYKGSTSDLEQRIAYHNNGFEKFTRNGIPWILCWSTVKPTKSEAVKLESKLKNLSRSRLYQFMLKYDNDLSNDGKEIIQRFEP